MPSLLVVDDEPNVLYSLVKSLHSEDLEVLTAGTGREGLELVQRRRPDAVILDVRLSDMSGLEVFDRARQIDPRLPIILITAFATTDNAIEAMKRGAFEYLLKPIDFHQLREVVERALKLSRFRHVPAVFDEAEAEDGSDRIVGRSAAMQEVYKAIGRVAHREVTVLITGESGTGKELVARALYHHSNRTGGPFLALNCAALPDTLLGSELFGHERGAFTGAERRRIGKFEQAHRGTLFLDEIGDMSAATQAKVLRVLHQQRFERLGGNETIQTDVRLIAATNKDLAREVAQGRFRSDLFYRLSTFNIRLPPLRERKDDLPLLIDHFVRVYSRSLRRNIRSVAAEVLHCLHEHDWPGNVRELQNVLRYAIIQTPGEVVTLDCLPENVRAPAPTLAAPAAAPEYPTVDVGQRTTQLLRAGESDIYRRVCLDVDRVVIETVLRHARGNQLQASELLGISRTTLRAKLRALGMTVQKALMPEANSGE
jgi:two-component system nitrogen regulation response regulator GlnG